MCRNNYDNLICLRISNFLYTIPFILKIQKKNRRTYRLTQPLLFWSTNDPEYFSNAFLLLWSFPAVHWTVVIMAQAVQKLVAKVPTAVGGKFIHLYSFYQLLIELAVVEQPAF